MKSQKKSVKRRIVPVVPENKRHMLDADGEKCLYCEQSETVIDTDAVCPARQSAFAGEQIRAAVPAGPLERLLQRSYEVLSHCEMCGADSSQHLEPGFTPSGQAKILCQSCRIGSAESLESKRLRLSSRQIATVLAALRHYQRTVGEKGAAMYTDHFRMSKQTPLTLDQIDDLAERINFGS